MRITGPAEKLYVLTLRYEVAAHLRAGRAMTLVRDRVVVEAGRNERFALVPSNRPKKARSIQRAATRSVELAPRPLVLSGLTIAGFEKHLPKNSAVIRSMPNTPASVGRGITVAVPNAHVRRRSAPPATGCCAPSARWPGSMTRA